MAKIKETKVQTTQWPNKRDKSTDKCCLVLLSLLFWPLCCLCFCLF
jgi:hypothetical protein